MVSYHDAAWLDNMALQYGIALDAFSRMVDCAADELARRLGHQDSAAVEDALLSEADLEGLDPLPIQFERRVAVLKDLRELMGEDLNLLRARIDLLSDAADTVADEIAAEKDWSAEEVSDTLCCYQIDWAKGFSKGFSAWLDEQEEKTRQLDVAAQQYIEKPVAGSECLQEVARWFSLETNMAATLLEAYAKDDKRSEMGFVEWAFEGGLNANHMPLPGV